MNRNNDIFPSWVYWAFLVACIAIGLVWMHDACGSSLPPMPKTRAKAALTSQGAGAASLVQKIVIPPAPKTNILLTWDWTADAANPASNVSFLVRSGTFLSPKSNWPPVAVVTSNSCKLLINKSAKLVLFTVQATNRVTHLVSPL